MSFLTQPFWVMLAQLLAFLEALRRMNKVAWIFFLFRLSSLHHGQICPFQAYARLISDPLQRPYCKAKLLCSRNGQNHLLDTACPIGHSARNRVGFDPGFEGGN